jgi:hypothetical protein
VAVLSSLVPNAVLNQLNSGDWTGMKAENVVKSAATSGAVRFFGNAVLLSIDNLEPSVFPLASRWNALMDHVIPPSIGARLTANFETAGSRFHLDDMQVEESAGLGFGITILLILLVLAHVVRRRSIRPPLTCKLDKRTALVCAGMWIALGVWMTQSGLTTAARFLDPFYIVLVAPVLACFGDSALPGKKWWRAACVAVFVLAALPLIISPARPLWPAKTFLRARGAEKSTSPLVRRAWTVYSVYSRRYNAFAPVLPVLPKDAERLGFYGKDDPETSLWRPFGSRRVLHICERDSSEALRERGIKYVLLSLEDLAQAGTNIADWSKARDGEIVFQMPLDLRAARGPSQWALVQLR